MTLTDIKKNLQRAFFCGDIDSKTWREDWRNEDIVELYDGNFCHKDKAFYCEVEGEWCHEDDAVCYQYKNGDERYTWQGSEIFDRLYHYDSEYYHPNSLDYHSLCLLHNGEVCNMDYARYVRDEGEYYHEDDCYWWESDDEYHLEPEGETGKLFGYHSKHRHDMSNGAVFSVGVEIEKEDEGIRESINAGELYDDHYFIAERDGSLDCDSGFEIVSPTLPLTERTIDYFEPVRWILSADYSKNCGGHIHFSERGKTGIETYAEMAPIVPLLYALYPKRKSASYCGRKKLIDMGKERYSSVNILHNRIEFRIFPAVKNMSNLEWRLELLRLWSKHKPTFSSVMRALSNKNSWLSLHLAKVCDWRAKKQQYSRELAYFLDSDIKISVNSANKVASKEISKLINKEPQEMIF